MQKHFLELIRRASTKLPNDVLTALGRGRDAETPGHPAHGALGEILKNCTLADTSSRPVCQDTGTAIWYIHRPRAEDEKVITDAILAATREATKLSYLRPNAVDSITGKNSGDNTGVGLPVIHIHEWEKNELAADLLLKGGGSENVSAQYSLPDDSIDAGRDLDGVRKAVIDAVFRAQGQGCGPGIIGVCIGGDRATGMAAAKAELLRNLEDVNSNPLLAELEKRLFNEMNTLGIGPMGFGGKTTVLGVKIGVLHRLPASFFVSIAYMCWALRRHSVSIVDGRPTYFERGAK